MSIIDSPVLVIKISREDFLDKTKREDIRKDYVAKLNIPVIVIPDQVSIEYYTKLDRYIIDVQSSSLEELEALKEHFMFSCKFILKKKGCYKTINKELIYEKMEII